MTFGLLGSPETDQWEWYRHLTILYAAMIQSGINFAEGSYGDGEFFCMLGYEGKTARGQEYNPQLRADLIRTLREPVGQWCCYWGSTKKPFRVECDAWLAKQHFPVTWFGHRVLPAANCNGALGPFFRAVRTRNTILVGPSHLKDLPEDVIGPHEHVEVHGTDAWRYVDETCERVSELLTSGNDLVLFSAGMAAPVMIHRLRQRWGTVATFWDVGAIFDPYCGVFSRKNYRLESWQRDIMPLNLR